jgi:hypothetical protein
MDLRLKEEFGITSVLMQDLVKNLQLRCLNRKRRLKLKVKNKMAVAKKDKKWIQKAINPAHKGYCTPMTKSTCTPKRKALAMTLKKIAKSK